MQVSRRLCRTTSVSHFTYQRIMRYNIALFHKNFIQMSIIIHSPLRTQHRNIIPSTTQIASRHHHAHRSRMNLCATSRKNIHPLMHSRSTAPRVPKRLMVIIPTTSAIHRHLQILRYQKTYQKYC